MNGIFGQESIGSIKLSCKCGETKSIWNEDGSFCISCGADFNTRKKFTAGVDLK